MRSNLFICFRTNCIYFPVNPLLRYFAHIYIRVLIFFLWISRSSLYFCEIYALLCYELQTFSPTCCLLTLHMVFLPFRSSGLYVVIQISSHRLPTHTDLRCFLYQMFKYIGFLVHFWTSFSVTLVYVSVPTRSPSTFNITNIQSTIYYKNCT